MSVPKHVGIILDGNRRYARQRLLPAGAGHAAGSEKVEKLLDWCNELGITELTLYTFSLENFKRSKSEVKQLLDLFKKRFEKVQREMHKVMKNGISIKFIGNKTLFPKDLQALMNNLEKKTAKNTKRKLNFAMGYSGRQEIIDAAAALAKDFKKGKVKAITEATFRKYLYLDAYPDLIIRTAGEQRLSNFLTFQSAYSEFCFVDKLWPAMSKKDFEKCIDDYSRRERRFGK